MCVRTYDMSGALPAASSSELPGRGRRWEWVAALWTCLVYALAVRAGSITDDATLLFDNPLMANSAGWRSLLSSDIAGDAAVTQYFRPLPLLTFWLQFRVGSSLGVLHAGNVVLMAGAAAALVHYLRQQWPALSPLAALALACAWIAHPLQSEAATWLSGRFDACLLLFSVLSLGANLRPERRWLTPLALAPALLSKESAVVLVPVLLAQDFVGARRLREELPKYAALAVLVLGYFSLRHAVGVASSSVLSMSSPWQLAEAYAVLLGTFSVSTLWPRALDVHHWFAPLPTALTIAILSSVTAALIGSTVALLRRKSWALGPFLALISLVPIALVLPPQRVYGDRFASLFLLGGVLFVAGLRPRRWLAPLAVLLALLGAVRTQFRLLEWRTLETLEVAALQRDPENPHWLLLSAYRHVDAGELASASSALERSLDAAPDYAKAWGLSCLLEIRQRHPLEALRACDWAIVGAPSVASHHVNRASALLNLGDMAGAEQAARTALALRTPYPEAEFVLAAALANLGRETEARSHVDLGLRQEPGHAGLRSLDAQLRTHGY
ncbi:MAG TPA: hypothetical protein VLC09_11975 [Polyangiaceae bacterium]|nr:hypothetical protein [Polyangiaceae bacterium]